MKRLLLTTFTAAVMFAGCAKNEIYDDTLNSSNEIQFSPNAGRQAKGTVVDGTNIMDFRVHSYVNSAVDASIYSFHGSSDIKRGGETLPWVSKPPIIWKYGQKHNFYAIHPSSTTHYSEDLPESGGVPSFTYNLPSADNQVDLLVGNRIGVDKTSEAVKISMKHVLTRLKIKAKVDSDTAPVGKKYGLKSVRILGTGRDGATEPNLMSKLYKSSVFTMSNVDGESGSWDKSTQHGNGVSIDPILNLNRGSGYGATYGSIDFESLQILPDPKDIFKDNQYLFLIPPSTEGITASTDMVLKVEYFILDESPSAVPAPGVAPADKIHHHTVTLAIPNGTMRPGKAYSAMIKIGVDTEVKFDVDVEGWQDEAGTSTSDITAAGATDANLVEAINEINERAKMSTIRDYRITVNAALPTTTINIRDAEVANLRLGDNITVTYTGAAKVTEGNKVVTPSGLKHSSITNGFRLTRINSERKTMAESNCYIINDAAIDLIIPISRVDKAWAFIESAEGYSSNKWRDDKSKGYKLEVAFDDFDTDLAVSTVEIKSTTNAAGNLEVTMPSNVKALIEAGCNVFVNLVCNDKTYWSWHLWFTEYGATSKPGQDSEDGKYHKYAGAAFLEGGLYFGKYIMDRDLGAKRANYNEGTDKVAVNNSMGLVYQWGRKDPFHLDLKWISTDPTGEKNNPVNISTSIANPRTYYAFTTTDNWVINNDVIATNPLWDLSKTIFDPCPVGWRVPYGGPDNKNNVWADFENKDVYKWGEFAYSYAPTAGSTLTTYGPYRYITYNGVQFRIGQKSWSAYTDKGNSNNASCLHGFKLPDVEQNKNDITGKASGLNIRCIQE